MNKNIKYSILCVAILLSSNFYFAAEAKELIKLPVNWRLPNANELDHSWRKENQNKFVEIEGDFNGDGKKDYARILINNKNSSFGIFVWFTTYKNKPIEVYIEKQNYLLPSMGIRIQKATSIKTACGKGYYDCKKDESESINLTNDSIDFFKTESANSIFHWDRKTNTFSRTWISD